MSILKAAIQKSKRSYRRDKTAKKKPETHIAHIIVVCGNSPYERWERCTNTNSVFELLPTYEDFFAEIFEKQLVRYERKWDAKTEKREKLVKIVRGAIIISIPLR